MKEHIDKGEAMSASTPMTAVSSLAELVTITPGKITKAMALRAEGANVVVLALDAGQELREHKTITPVLVQVLQGELTVTTATDTVTLHPGGLVHFPALLPHAVAAVSPTIMTITLLTGSGSTPPPEPGAVPLVLEEGPQV